MGKMREISETNERGLTIYQKHKELNSFILIISFLPKLLLSTLVHLLQYFLALIESTNLSTSLIDYSYRFINILLDEILV